MTTANEKFNRQSAFRNWLTSTAVTIGPDMRDRTHLNFSPRLGFAWDVFWQWNHICSRGAGVYYDLANIGMDLEQSHASMPPFSGQVDRPNRTQKFTLPLSNLLTVERGVRQGGLAAQGVDTTRIGPIYGFTIWRLIASFLGARRYRWLMLDSRGAHLWDITDAEPAMPIVVVERDTGVQISPVPNPVIGSTIPMQLTQPPGTTRCRCRQQTFKPGTAIPGCVRMRCWRDETQGQEDVSDCTAAPPPGLEGVDPAHPLTDKGPACFE